MKWWLKTLAGAVAGAAATMFAAFLVIAGAYASMSNTTHDFLYAGSLGIGAAVGAMLAGAQDIRSAWPSLVLGLLVAGGFVAAIRSSVIDLTGIEPVFLVLVSAAAATIGIWLGRRVAGNGPPDHPHVS